MFNDTTTVIWILIALIITLLVAACIVSYSKVRTRLLHTNSIDIENSSPNARYWKVVTGTIKKSALDVRKQKGFLMQTSKQYRARITYEYFAYDRPYIHTTPLMYWSSNRGKAIHYLEKHKSGDSIVVRFHPKQPESSIIELNM